LPDATHWRYGESITAPFIDLTVPDGPAVVLRTRHQTVAEAEEPNRYRPELERVFPVRDPARADRVHPDFVDPANDLRCAATVHLEDVTVSKRRIDDLMVFVGANFRTALGRQSDFHERLTRSIRAELTAMQEGKQPPAADLLDVVRIQREHCASDSEYQALQNQLGVVLKPGKSAGQIAGRLLAIFAGAWIRSAEDRAAYEASLNEQGAERAWDYEASVSVGREEETWAPFERGNVAQYMNTTLVLENDGKLKVDPKGTNAALFPAKIRLRSANGEERVVTMLAVVQTRPIAPGEQVRLDYGDEYALHGNAAEDSASVKDEPMDIDLAESPASPQASDSVAVRGRNTAPPQPIDALLEQESIRSSVAAVQAHLSAFERNRQAMTNVLSARGLHVIGNDGGQANNCLIISLLQHATQNYDSHHGDAALQVRSALIAEFPELDFDGPLHSDDPASQWLIEHILQAYGGGVDREVIFLEPGDQGIPIPRVARGGNDPMAAVAVANWGTHFEAVRNQGNLSWIEHLAELAQTPDERTQPEQQPILIDAVSTTRIASTAPRPSVPAIDQIMSGRTLSAEQQGWLDAAQQACPRPSKMKSDLAYARLLKTKDPRLNNAALAKASGARVSDIARDSKINAPALSAEQQGWLDAAQQACPRPSKMKSDLAYARLLKDQDPRLDNAALAKASGAKIANIEADPKINAPVLSAEQQGWLDAAQQACPRPSELKSDLAYARLLKDEDPRLDSAALAKASGATVANIEADPKINAPVLSAEQQGWLDAAQQACPRPSELKSDLVYARLLKTKDPRLDNAALAKASGATVANIEADPKINAPALSAEQQSWLDAAQQACPRPSELKSDIAYARLLKTKDPRLNIAALAKASGALPSNIARAATKWDRSR
jgi:hypothetical protein